MWSSLIGSIFVLILALQGCGGAAQALQDPTETVASRQYDHIFVVVEENEEASSILGNPNTPTFNRIAQRYGLATSYFGVIHPSEGNYVALTDANSHGVTDDDPYMDHRFSNATLVDRLEDAGLTWKGYFQSMPSPGFLGACYPRELDCVYASKHNGFMNFSQISGNVDRLSHLVPDSGLGEDLSNGTVPNYSFVVPDQCHDMHGLPSCSDLTANIRVADEYLRTLLDEIMGSATWQEGRNAIVVTFDEGETSSGCCGAGNSEGGGGGKILTVVITNQGLGAVEDATPYNHYSLVATIEKAFGLPCTQLACDHANVPTMDTLFELQEPAVASVTANRARRSS